MQAAIRRNLAAGGRRETPGARRRQLPGPAESLRALTEKRRKLLELHYNDRISAAGFGEEEARLAAAIEATRQEVSYEAEEERARSDVEIRFEAVAAVLRDLDIETVWNAAEEQERRILVEELIARISVFPDHLQVTVSGAHPLHVLYQEVGLKQSDSVGVGGRDLIELSREDPIHPRKPVHQNWPDRILLQSGAGRPLVSGRVGRSSSAPECQGCLDLSR